MNELLSLAEITLQNLSTGVLHLLKAEIGENGTVAGVGSQILICISRADFEQRLGNLLQRIYRTVDQHFPVRGQQLSIVIRDTDDKYENTFKIWPTS